MAKKEVKDRLMKKMYIYAFLLLLFFGATAILGSFIGSQIDKQFNIRPWGTVITMVVSYILSWLLAKPMSVKITKLLDKENAKSTK